MSGNQDRKQQDFARSMAAGIKPETQVVYVADTNHFRQAEIYGAVLNKPFWDEMKHNGKNNIVATERYISSTKPIFDAFFNKQISRAEFLSCFGSGETTGQTTEAEGKQIAQGFADIMEKGVRVIPANNGQGLGGENYMRAQADMTAIRLDSFRWLHEHRGEINKDPKALAFRLMEQNDAMAMSGQVREDYVQIKKATLEKIEKNEPLTQDYLTALHDVANPHYAAYLDHASKVEESGMDTKNRRARDDQVVATIQQAAEQPNSRVFLLYGAGHAAGPDGIMAQLHQNGLQAELVVPYLGKDHYACLKTDNIICAMMKPADMEKIINDGLRDVNYTQIPVDEPSRKVEHKAETPARG